MDEAVEQLASQVEQPRKGPSAVAAVPLADDGFVDFLLAGTATRGEFWCTDCGYGAVIQRALPTCPMCGGEIWELRPPSGPQLAD